MQLLILHHLLLIILPYKLHMLSKDNDFYLVTEYCDPGDLCKYLRDPHVNLPWGIRVRMASDIASAMAYLHAKNITHRDLKSQNCLITENWRVKLCDFGFARKVTGTGQPAFMTLCGTDDFMSPEIILGEDYDERSDIFSFGLLLCEIIIRRRICDVLPRSPATFFGVEEKMFWSQIPKDCPQAFSQLAWSCVAYYPKDRPPFKEILNKLRGIEKEVMASSGGIQTPFLEPPPVDKKKARRQSERRLTRLDSLPITVGEPGSDLCDPSDYPPEPSPRRKKDKQAVLKQLVDEFFKRREKTEKEKKEKEEKRQLKEQIKEERRLQKEEEKRQHHEAPTSPRKNKLAFSAEVPNSLKLSGEVEPEEEDKQTRKKNHRISLNLGVLGMGTGHDKRNNRRSIAVGKTMAPDPSQSAEAKG